MYRYGFFISGLYGSKLEDSFLTKRIRRILKEFPEAVNQFFIPEGIVGTFFSLFYENQEELDPDLLAASVNQYIDTIIVFDSDLCNIYIHKGIGDAQTVFDDNHLRIQTIYEGIFESPFEWIDIIDKRITAHAFPCPN